ncbi:D-aminoacid aminotransferase-like PLP-dependent enzymes superfamily protein isoform 3 [Theobroma cacao]|uniref:Branched-chain-amino-acid aminotransferase n=1 Tax=Theobroma cacao TaxID=3641 RepID=A0A061DX62_THECC|nr:D-aminoacid aminotransferase-like PLP-dependent enzymes superfamily protein isoform 3 [Theobroma cacao]
MLLLISYTASEQPVGFLTYLSFLLIAAKIMAPAPVSFTSVTRDGEETYADIDWDQLGFALTPADYMYVMKCSNKEDFPQGQLVCYGNIEISPFSAVLNYGQVPPHGKGSLYLRPLLMGSGPVLGLVPAPECTFMISGTPIGNHFLTNHGAANLYIEDKLPRASPGGTGSIKSITNYSPVFEAVSQAKAKGFSDVLFLDAATGKYIEEVSSSNVFIVKGNVISTPPINGTVLPGITRKSIMELALDMGYQVEEGNIPVEDLMSADEVFCTGTVVIVTPVGSITYQDTRAEYKTGEGTVCNKLRATLSGIQMGLIQDKKGWTVALD